MRILYVEDNQELAQQIAHALKEQHYAIDVATDGQQGWEFLISTSYDLVLMDVTLPKLDGVSLCRRMRSKGYRAPILMLTAKSNSQDQVLGLDAGADDYMIKPIGISELSARIRALMRRGGAGVESILTWGKLKLDPNQREVWYGDRQVPVTPKEYALLELMLRNNHQVVSRKAFLEGMWSYEEDVPEEDTIKAHVKGLRRKLRVFNADDLIETIYGVGYRLNSAYLDTVRPAHQRELLNLKVAHLLIEKLLHIAKRYDRSFCYVTLKVEHWSQWSPKMQRALVQKMAQVLHSHLGIEDIVADAENGQFVIGMYDVAHQEGRDRLEPLLKLLREIEVTTLAPLKLGIAVAVYPTDGTTIAALSQYNEDTLSWAEGESCDRT